MKTAIVIVAAVSFSLTLSSCGGEEDRRRRVIEAELAALKAEEKAHALAEQKALLQEFDKQISETEELLENVQTDAEREAVQKLLQDLRDKRIIAEKVGKAPEKPAELPPECIDNPLSPNCP